MSGKKLIIQIPCLNEAKTLPTTLRDLPRSIEGIEAIEVLIIDDGSTDNTVDIAKQLGVNHIIHHTTNQGLAKAFMTGITECLARGADIIVNTDADNQYKGEDIKELVRPIINGEAEIVVGARPISDIKHFSPAKKALQKIGSLTVRIASNTDIEDAPSGFRAFSRFAARQINVFSEYTYTLETIIQAGQKNIPIKSVAIRTNADLRPSRLVKSIPAYIRRSIITMVRIFIVYRPFRFFTYLALFFFSAGSILLLRYLLLYISGDGSGHIQSIILGSICMIFSSQLLLLGFIADLQSVNRKILEDVRAKLLK